MTKAARTIRKTLHREYKREMSKYWVLPFVTRLKLAWAIAWRIRK